MSLEFASLTGTFAVGQDGVEQLPVPLGGFEDRVEGTEIQFAGVLVDRQAGVGVEPGQGVGRQPGEVAVEIHLRPAPRVDPPIGAQLVGVETDGPPRLAVESQRCRGRAHRGTTLLPLLRCPVGARRRDAYDGGERGHTSPWARTR